MRQSSRVRVYTQYNGAVKDIILSCSYEYEWKSRLGPYILSQAQILPINTTRCTESYKSYLADTKQL